MTSLSMISQQWLAWLSAITWQVALLVCIAAIVSIVARSASPRLRHGLWLLVLAKVFLPPALWTPLSVGHWGVGPVLDAARVPRDAAVALPPAAPSVQQRAELHGREAPLHQLAVQRSLATLLMLVWMMGSVSFWGIIAWRYLWLTRAIGPATPLDEGPLRIALERIALELQVKRVPDLLVADALASPFLFGVLRPRIVLPQKLVGTLNDLELRAILTHELVHWKRRDTWIGWLQLLAQSLLWFHPFLWWANSQLRHERECVCDEMVLQHGGISPEHYGESMVRLLTATRARALVGASLVGVFERGAKLQYRLENIMNYAPRQQRFGWLPRLALVGFAIFFLPMAPGFIQRPVVVAQESTQPAAARQPAERTPFPRIIKSIPEPGARNVDPDLQEISVTFDRDMSQGMSWTGGPPLFPPLDNQRRPRWTDARTCVLPVRLEEESFYRLGINSTSHQNFRSHDDVPAPPSALYFTTRGAGRSLESRLRVPQIVELEPANGATDVDPSTKMLRVTFNMPMGEGMSWTGGGSQFPQIPDAEKSRWSADSRTCFLPVVLQPEHEYRLGLNSLNHINFQSKWGVPLAPITYTFRTRGNN